MYYYHTVYFYDILRDFTYKMKCTVLGNGYSFDKLKTMGRFTLLDYLLDLSKCPNVNAI